MAGALLSLYFIESVDRENSRIASLPGLLGKGCFIEDIGHFWIAYVILLSLESSKFENIHCLCPKLTMLWNNFSILTFVIVQGHGCSQKRKEGWFFFFILHDL